MLDFVIGTKAKPAAVDNLLDSLRRMKPADGIVYVGFPVVATESETSTIDALLTSSRFGVVVFDLLDSPPSPHAWEEIEERQSRLVAGLTSRLLLHKDLRKGPQLAFTVHVVTYSSNRVRPPKGKELTVAWPDNLHTVLEALPTFPPKLLLHLNAALQSVSTIKPRKKRSLVKGSSTRGAILKEIEKNIANLDRWQRQGAIETPEGPQRIRGLAGAGKTIVLALKAAYLHAQHPDWTIGVTFYTRSLYQQFRDLIRRFHFDQQRDEPDWTRLRILHAWGSPRDPGVYSEIADALRRPLEDFASARSKHGMEKPFEGICVELLTATAGHAFEPIFDALLIDEAQDLPVPFFRLAYQATRDPKRIVWAYDELQNLETYSMAPPEELFGATSDGSPLITLRNIDGAPHQTDIREYASWLEYVALVRERQYTALLSDFSLLQMSCWLERGSIVKHRLGYFPCPLLVDPDEVEEWGLLDWLELLRGEDLRERLRQDAPLRFDFDPAASGEGHSASHLHVSRQCCRIPVYAPLSPGRFIRFIFSHFYPNDWNRSGFLRSWPCRQVSRTISPAERRELHLSVEND